jgi:hypothetical protein
VSPTFRTACQYLMIGAIKINYEAAWIYLCYFVKSKEEQKCIDLGSINEY